MSPHERMEQIQALCDVVAEMSLNCGSDLVGDHRENYNPRIAKATSALIRLYPDQMVIAVAKAKYF